MRTRYHSVIGNSNSKRPKLPKRKGLTTTTLHAIHQTVLIKYQLEKTNRWLSPSGHNNACLLELEQSRREEKRYENCAADGLGMVHKHLFLWFGLRWPKRPGTTIAEIKWKETKTVPRHALPWLTPDGKTRTIWGSFKIFRCWISVIKFYDNDEKNVGRTTSRNTCVSHSTGLDHPAGTCQTIYLTCGWQNISEQKSINMMNMLNFFFTGKKKWQSSALSSRDHIPETWWGIVALHRFFMFFFGNEHGT